MPLSQVVTKPITKRALNAQTHAVNGANTFSRSFITVSGSTTSCVQNAALTTVTFNGLTNSATGVAASGISTIDITFQMEA
jgi:hypothetical protein